MTTTQDNTTGEAQEPRLRASDLDRLATVRVLQDAVARGLLTPDEGSDRMAAAFAAVHVADLAPLTADLPTSQQRTAPGWRPLGSMAMDQVRSSLHAPWSGRLSPARIAVAVFIAFVLVMLIGSMFADLFFDGGGDFGHHHGFDRD